MIFRKQTNIFFRRFLKIGLWGSLSLGAICAQDSDSILTVESYTILLPDYIPSSPYVINPFPQASLALVQPLDSILIPIGILKFPYESRKTDIELSWDWQTITISETVDGYQVQMPFTASVEWYLDKFHQQAWHKKFIETMPAEAKDDTRRLGV